MKIKSYVNVIGVNCGPFDLFYKGIRFFIIGGAENLKKFILDVVICDNEIVIQQSILSDIVYITTATIMDYERVIEWLNTNAEEYVE